RGPEVVDDLDGRKDGGERRAEFVRGEGHETRLEVGELALAKERAPRFFFRALAKRDVEEEPDRSLAEVRAIECLRRHVAPPRRAVLAPDFPVALVGAVALERGDAFLQELRPVAMVVEGDLAGLADGFSVAPAEHGPLERVVDPLDAAVLYEHHAHRCGLEY